MSSTQDLQSEQLLLNKPLSGRKILIIVENLPVPFDRRVWQEAQTLTAAGAVVSIICPRTKLHPERMEVIDGINVYRHPLPEDIGSLVGYLIEYGTALFWQTVLAFKVWRRHGFDVIHGCNPPDLIFLVALIFKIFGKKFLFDHHDINPEFYEAKFGRRDFFWNLLRIAERLTFKTATVSIATNNSFRSIAIERGGMHPDKVFVVRSGPDLRRLKEVPPNPKWRNGRKFLVGYVGVMGPQEGIDLLLESARTIVSDQHRTDVQFCLVGGGPSLDKLRTQSDAMGLSEYVTFTGRLPDSDLFEVLSTSDVCVNPDRVNEMNDKSTMNKILEYMAFGKPIVQFDVQEGRYSAEGASLYATANDPYDFADKILDLLKHREQRIIMGEMGRERVRMKLSWEHEIPNLIAAYQSLFKMHVYNQVNLEGLPEPR
ncbi:glycosyltransferase family 4 protein [Microvirga arvi]|uniref:glycosyltransferase family 4 protein n=1 Tax=Microvirga arvi TaxID=2778731 RepID=UPI001EF4C876|nr:glycosyltransferase family 4 protein [Microvirga arvi]